MKKFVLFLFTLVIGFAVFCGLYVKADPSPLTMTDGAQIRTSGEFQGLRFEAAASSLEGVDEHGFYLAAGEHTLDAMRTAIEAGEATVGGNKLVKKSATGEALEFAVTVYGMDDVSEYAQLITVVAYLKAGGTFTLDKAVTRNIANIAREDYNKTADPAEIISTVAEATRVKVTHSDSSVEYFGDTSEVTLAAGDTLDLTRGDYSNAFTINQSNVTLNGVYKNVAMNTTGARKTASFAGETTFTNELVVNSALTNVTINGVKVAASNGIQLATGDSANANILNCNILYSESYGIYKSDIGGTLDKLLVENCYIHGSTTAESKGIYLNTQSKMVLIYNNYVGNDVDLRYAENGAIRIHSVNDFGILVSKLQNPGFVEIRGNLIDHKCAEQLIDVCGYNSTSTTIKAYVNIENNILNKTRSTILGGNGIRVYGFAGDSSISVIHNIDGRFSGYMNTLSIKRNTKNGAVSQQNSGKDTPNASGPVRVDILCNSFFTTDGANVAQPKDYLGEGSAKEYAKTNRIAFGFVYNSKLVLKGNYFGSSASLYAYAANTSASGGLSAYFKDYSSFDVKSAAVVEKSGSTSAVDTYYTDTVLTKIEDFEALIDGFNGESAYDDILAALKGTAYENVLAVESETLKIKDAFAPYILALAKRGIFGEVVSSAVTGDNIAAPAA